MPEPQNAIEEPQDEGQDKSQEIDLSKKFSENWNKAREAERRAWTTQLNEKFGVMSLDELAEKISAPKPDAKKPDDSDKKVLTEYEQKISELEKMVSSLKSQTEQTRVEAELAQALASLPNPPRKGSVVMREFLDSYEVRLENGETRVYRRGRDIPETNGEGELAKPLDVLKTWAEQPDNQWLFARGTGNGVNLSQGRPQTGQLPAGFMKDPANVEALKKTGQFAAAMSGKPVDMTKIKAELNKSASV